MRRGNVLASTSSVGECDKDDGFAETVLGSQGNHRKERRRWTLGWGRAFWWM